MITTTVTPQPLHAHPGLSVTELRNTFETELWDDNSDVIFAAKAVTLSVIVRVPCRAWITAQADLDAAGTLTINVDSVAQTPTTTVAGAITAVVNTFADLKPGNHTVTITSAAALTDPLIMVRRGRKSPGV